MQITNQALFAIQVAKELAKAEGLLSNADIAEQLDITISYATQITHAMKKAGLVIGRKGRTGGGYKLAKPPDRITLADFLDGVDGGICPDVETDSKALRKTREVVRKIVKDAAATKKLKDL